MALGTRTPETEALFAIYELQGNVGARSAADRLQLLIDLSKLGFDRSLTPAGDLLARQENVLTADRR